MPSGDIDVDADSPTGASGSGVVAVAPCGAVRPVRTCGPETLRQFVSEAERVEKAGLFTPTRDRVLALAWLASGTIVVLVSLKLFVRRWMIDGATFYDVWRVSPMYHLPPATQGAYLYSPLFAQVISPLTHLPWWAFSAVWLLAATGAYVWLVAPVGWLWAIPLLGLAPEDVTIGNTAWLLATACVIGMRSPAAWAVPVLTKITTGVGLIWFVPRRDWRALAAAAAATAVAVGLSWVIAPQLWLEWVAFLSENRSHDPWLVFRVLLAAALVWNASLRDRAWLIPVAMYVATPVLMVYGLGMLCAIPRLLSPEALARARAPFGTPAQFARRVLDLPLAP